MINLLSPHAKKELSSARRNVLLRRYVVYIFLAILAVGGIYAAAFIITVQQQLTAQNDLEEARIQSEQYAQVREKAEQFSQNLDTARVILSDEIIYSTLITDIAQTLPPNVVLTSLTLNPDVFGAATTLEARAHSPESVLNLKAILEASPLFSDVNIASIVEEAGIESEDAQLPPFAVTMNVIIASPQEIEATQTPQSGGDS